MIPQGLARANALHAVDTGRPGLAEVDAPQ